MGELVLARIQQEFSFSKSEAKIVKEIEARVKLGEKPNLTNQHQQEYYDILIKIKNIEQTLNHDFANALAAENIKRFDLSCKLNLIPSRLQYLENLAKPARLPKSRKS